MKKVGDRKNKRIQRAFAESEKRKRKGMGREINNMTTTNFFINVLIYK